MTGILITVKIQTPKYVRGIYKFASLEKLYDLLTLIRSFGEDNLSSFIFTFAKRRKTKHQQIWFVYRRKAGLPRLCLGKRFG